MRDEPSLKRELGLRDLTLFAIACIVGCPLDSGCRACRSRFGHAVAAGGGLLRRARSLSPWQRCASKYPGAGGLYLWTRGDFGPWHGFLCFWIYWMGIAFWFPSAAMFYMTRGCLYAGSILRAPRRQPRLPGRRIAAGHLDRAGNQHDRHEDRQVDRESRRHRHLGDRRGFCHDCRAGMVETRLRDAPRCRADAATGKPRASGRASPTR